MPEASVFREFQSQTIEGFDFFGFARVGPDTSDAGGGFEDCFGYGFTLHSLDSRATLVFVFDAGIDADYCAELANTLASRFADGVAGMISPPVLLEEYRLKKLFQLTSGASAQRRSFNHVAIAGTQARSFKIRAYLLGGSQMEPAQRAAKEMTDVLDPENRL